MASPILPLGFRPSPQRMGAKAPIIVRSRPVWRDYTGPASFRSPIAPRVQPPRSDVGIFGDTYSSFAQGGLGGLQAITDVFGADNAASETLRNARDYWAERISPERRAELDKQEREKAELGEDAPVWERAALFGRQAIRNPLQTVAEGFGNVAPLAGVGGAGRLVGLGARAAAVGLGSVMGAGATKGNIYETTLQGLISKGVPPETAKARAAEAQSYAENPGLIAAGTAIGGIAGRLGADEAIAGLASREARNLTREQLTKQALNFGPRGALIGAGREAFTEAPQEAFETRAGNEGAIRAGVVMDPNRGVLEAGVKAGIMSAVPGGAVNLASGYGAKRNLVDMFGQPAPDSLVDDLKTDALPGDVGGDEEFPNFLNLRGQNPRLGLGFDQYAQIVLDADAQGVSSQDALVTAGVPKKKVAAILAKVRATMGPKVAPTKVESPKVVDKREDAKKPNIDAIFGRLVLQEKGSRTSFDDAVASFDEDPLAPTRTRVATPEEAASEMEETDRAVLRAENEADQIEQLRSERDRRGNEVVDEKYAPLLEAHREARAAAERALDAQQMGPKLTEAERLRAERERVSEMGGPAFRLRNQILELADQSNNPTDVILRAGHPEWFPTANQARKALEEFRKAKASVDNAKTPGAGVSEDSISDKIGVDGLGVLPKSLVDSSGLQVPIQAAGEGIGLKRLAGQVGEVPSEADGIAKGMDTVDRSVEDLSAGDARAGVGRGGENASLLESGDAGALARVAQGFHHDVGQSDKGSDNGTTVETVESHSESVPPSVQARGRNFTVEESDGEVFLTGRGKPPAIYRLVKIGPNEYTTDNENRMSRGGRPGGPEDALPGVQFSKTDDGRWIAKETELSERTTPPAGTAPSGVAMALARSVDLERGLDKALDRIQAEARMESARKANQPEVDAGFARADAFLRERFGALDTELDPRYDPRFGNPDAPRQVTEADLEEAVADASRNRAQRETPAVSVTDQGAREKDAVAAVPAKSATDLGGREASIVGTRGQNLEANEAAVDASQSEPRVSGRLPEQKVEDRSESEPKQKASHAESLPERVKTTAKSLQPGDLLIGSGHTILGVTRSFVAKDETQKGKVEVRYRTAKGEERTAYWNPSTSITVERGKPEATEPVPVEPVAEEPQATVEPPQTRGDLFKSGEREALIGRIVEAAKKPMMKIRERFELKGTDGKWYRGSMPRGVESVKPTERRSMGFSFETPQGTAVGTLTKSREELEANYRKAKDSDAEDFRSKLEGMSDERLKSQAEYWLKEEKPAPAPKAEKKLSDSDRQHELKREILGPKPMPTTSQAFDDWAKRRNYLDTLNTGELEDELARVDENRSKTPAQRITEARERMRTKSPSETAAGTDKAASLKARVTAAKENLERAKAAQDVAKGKRDKDKLQKRIDVLDKEYYDAMRAEWAAERERLKIEGEPAQKIIVAVEKWADVDAKALLPIVTEAIEANEQAQSLPKDVRAKLAKDLSDNTWTTFYSLVTEKGLTKAVAVSVDVELAKVQEKKAVAEIEAMEGLIERTGYGQKSKQTYKDDVRRAGRVEDIEKVMKAVRADNEAGLAKKAESDRIEAQQVELERKRIESLKEPLPADTAKEINDLTAGEYGALQIANIDAEGAAFAGSAATNERLRKRGLMVADTVQLTEKGKVLATAVQRYDARLKVGVPISERTPTKGRFADATTADEGLMTTKVNGKDWYTQGNWLVRGTLPEKRGAQPVKMSERGFTPDMVEKSIAPKKGLGDPVKPVAFFVDDKSGDERIVMSSGTIIKGVFMDHVLALHPGATLSSVGDESAVYFKNKKGDIVGIVMPIRGPAPDGALALVERPVEDQKQVDPNDYSDQDDYVDARFEASRVGETLDSEKIKAEWLDAHPEEAEKRSDAAKQRTLGEDEGPKAEEPKRAIADVGEKLGGARKDLAVKTGPRAEKVEDERPTWAKRFNVSQTVSSSDVTEEGKWIVTPAKTDRFNFRALGTFDTKEQAEAFLPIAAVGESHRAYKGNDGRFMIHRKIGDRRLVQVVKETFETREEAMAYMAAHAEEILDVKTNFGEEVLPRPDPNNVQRIGAARRTGDVDENNFKDTFGFRAVEFGKWQAQDERQTVMNHAYDSLLDLAETLGIPPKAISLEGELGLGFGSRGHGLTGARAHYERDYGVINLTKMKGAGALAHELWHSFDHYFGRQRAANPNERVVNDRGDKVFKETSMISEGGYAKGVREEVAAKMKALVSTMSNKAEKFVEDTQRVEKWVGQTRDDLKTRLADIRRNLSAPESYTKKPAASAEQLARFDALAEQIVNGEAITLEWKPGKIGNHPSSRRLSMSGGRYTNAALDELSDILKKVRGRSGFAKDTGALTQLTPYIKRYAERIEQAKSAATGEEKTKSVPTQFAMNARSADQGRVKAYWSTPVEMSARAFQSYVEDRLSNEGAQNDFLTYGTKNAVIPTPWGLVRPYPLGDERTALNAAFDDLFKTIQTKETDKGVAMFATAPAFYSQLERVVSDPKTPKTQPVTLETVRKAMPGVQFTVQPDGSFVSKDGSLRVLANATIEVTPAQRAAFERSSEAGGGGDRAPVGVYEDGLIRIASGAPEGTAEHEFLHWLFANKFTPAERARLVEKFGDEEAAAYAFPEFKKAYDSNRESFLGRMFRRVQDFVRRMLNYFRPTWRSTFAEAASGRAAQRVAEKVETAEAPDIRYATARKDGGAEIEEGGKLSIPDETTLNQIEAKLRASLNRLGVIQGAVEKAIGKPLGYDLQAQQEGIDSRAAPVFERAAEKVLKPAAQIVADKRLDWKTTGEYARAVEALQATDEQRKARGIKMTKAEAQAIIDRVQKTGQRAAYEAFRDRIKAIRAISEAFRVNHGLATVEELEAKREKNGPEAVGNDSEIHPYIVEARKLHKAIMDSEVNRTRQDLAGVVKEVGLPGFGTVREGKPGKNGIGFKVDGEQFSIDFADERLVEQMKGLSVVRAEALTQTIGAVTRYLSRIQTSYSPTFAVTNPTRDYMGASFISYILHGMPKGFSDSMVRRVITGERKAILGARELLKNKTGKFEKGSPGWWVQEAARNGAIPGFFDQLSRVESVEDEITEMVKAGQTKGQVLKMTAEEMKAEFGKKTPGGAFQALRLGADAASRVLGLEVAAKKVLYFNQIGEIATRANVYRAGVESGLTERNAGNEARQLFHPKGGDWKRPMNALYTFFTSQIEGVGRLGEMLRSNDPGVKRRAWGTMAGLMAAGVMWDVMIAAFSGDADDDDIPDSDQLPSWQSERNLVVPLAGNLGTLLVPFAQGFNLPFFLGQMLSKVGRGRINKEKFVSDTASAAMNTFNPISSESGFPTALQIPLEVVANKDFFTGRKISPIKYPGQEWKPDSSVAFRGTSGASKTIAAGVNRLTGGDESKAGSIDVSPGTLDHVAKAVGGGALRFVSDSSQAMSDLLHKKAPKKIPVVSTFVKPSDAGYKSRFYSQLQDLDDITARRNNKQKVAAVQELAERFPGRDFSNESLTDLKKAIAEVGGLSAERREWLLGELDALDVSRLSVKKFADGAEKRIKGLMNQPESDVRDAEIERVILALNREYQKAAGGKQ